MSKPLRTALLAIAIILLDLAEAALYTAQARVRLAQFNNEHSDKSPWVRWAKNEGKATLAALEKDYDGRI